MLPEVRLRPPRDSVVVVPEEKRAGGLIHRPDYVNRASQTGKDRCYAWVGRVVRLGEKARAEGNVREGERVMYAKGASFVCKLDGRELHVVHRTSLLFAMGEHDLVEPVEA